MYVKLKSFYETMKCLLKVHSFTCLSSCVNYKFNDIILKIQLIPNIKLL